MYSGVLEKVARSRWCCVLWWTGSEKSVGTANMGVTWLTCRWILSRAQRWYNSTILSWATSKQSHSCVLVNRLYVRHARCGCVFYVHLRWIVHSLLIILRGTPPPLLLPSGILPLCRRRRQSMRQVSLLLLIPPQSCLSTNNVVIFFRSLKLLIRNLTFCLLAWMAVKSCPFAAMNSSCSRWHSRFASS